MVAFCTVYNGFRHIYQSPFWQLGLISALSLCIKKVPTITWQ